MTLPQRAPLPVVARRVKWILTSYEMPAEGSIKASALLPGVHEGRHCQEALFVEEQRTLVRSGIE